MSLFDFAFFGIAVFLFLALLYFFLALLYQQYEHIITLYNVMIVVSILVKNTQ